MTTSVSDGATRLLIIDDDDAVQSLMDAIFRRQAVMVEHAGDGKIALELLRRESFDVVVLDLMLPEMNGFELIRELKHRDLDVLSRTIVLTAASDSMLLHFNDARLVRRVMRKPFELTDFVHEVFSCAGVVPNLAVLPFEHHAH
jgi:DNA-binding response OmpR family regulator